MKRTLIFAVAAFCLATFAASAGQRLMVAHGIAETHSAHSGWLKFKEFIEKESGGEMTVQIFPNAQMGADRELTEAVQLGNIQLGCSASAPMAAFAPKFYVFDIPFLFDNREQAFKVLDSAAGDGLLASLEDYELHGFGYMDNGFRNLTTTDFRVESPADLAGRKIRTMQNQQHLKAWSLLGANPTSVAFSELIPALQQGTVDGQENPWEVIDTSKLCDVQEYAISTEHIYSPQVVFCNLEFWNGLNDKDRALIEKGIALCIETQRSLSVTNEENAVKRIRTTSEFITLAPEQKQKFKDMTAPVIDDVRALAGDDVVDAFLSGR